VSDREAQRAAAKAARKAAADVAHKAAVEKYGDEDDDGCRLTEASGHFFVFRRPNRGEYARLKTEAKDGGSFNAILLDTLQHPAREEFSRLCDRYPALEDELGPVVLELAGLTGEALAKKR
jgi:hypothetical protein